MSRLLNIAGRGLQGFNGDTSNASKSKSKILTELRSAVFRQEVENAVHILCDTETIAVISALKEQVLKIRQIPGLSDQEKGEAKRALIDAIKSHELQSQDLNRFFEVAWSHGGSEQSSFESFCFGCAEGRFTVDSEGVWFQKISIDGSYSSRQKICTPIIVEGKISTKQNENWGLVLTWWDLDGKKHTWAMPMNYMIDSDKILVKTLLSGGVVFDHNRKVQPLIKTYLSYYPSYRRILSVNTLGWHGENYVLPEATIGPDAGKLIFQADDGNVLPGYEQSGSLQEWRENVSSLALGNSMVMFSISSAFAGPLLNSLNIEGGGFHFVGDSSLGKSTSCMAAISVWGSPELKRSWRSTVNGLEGIAAQHNDNFLVLDEIKESSPKEVAGAAYMLANGHGKTVMSSTRRVSAVRRWRLIYLSNGELSLGDMIKSSGQQFFAGQDVRLAEIPVDAGVGFGAFENIHECADSKTFSEKLVLVSKKFYGTAGIEFIKQLTAKMKDPAFTETLRTKINTLAQRLIPKEASSTSQLSRVAKRFAVVAVAGELATEMGLTGWQEGDATSSVTKQFNSFLKNKGPDIPKEQEIIDCAKKFFQDNKDNFIPIKEAATSQNRPVIGYKEVDRQGKTIYYVSTEVFAERICPEQPQKLLKEVLVQSGLMIKPSQGYAANKSIPGHGSPKLYTFSGKVFSDED